MNLALSALLILLLLLPAFSFRIGIAVFSSGRRLQTNNANAFQHNLTSRNVSKALSKLNFTETIFLFSLVPVILHLLSIIILTWTSGSIKFNLLLNIFSGKDDILKDSSDPVFQKDIKCFLIYTIAEALAGFLAGLLLSWLLLRREWMVRALMGNNIWFKLFTGASLPNNKRDKIDSILIEVLTITKETTVIYSGFLKNYEVMPDSDQLSYLNVQSASRRDLRAGQIASKIKGTDPIMESTSSIYDENYGPLINIPGDNFTILGKDIINVNITYLELTTDPNDPNKKILTRLT